MIFSGLCYDNLGKVFLFLIWNFFFSHTFCWAVYLLFITLFPGERTDRPENAVHPVSSEESGLLPLQYGSVTGFSAGSAASAARPYPTGLPAARCR
jgi:hypothetical protein